jgi:ADP-ribose pyrophosphatase YjhB (NUDIX family)
MADDELPGVIETLTRDQYRDLYREDYALFDPAAETGPGTQPYVDASLAADNSLILFNDAVTIGNGTNLDTSTGSWLLQIGQSEGVFKLPPAGGSGFVIASTSPGGATIYQNDQLVAAPSGLRFLVTATGLYEDGAIVPIIGLDTGEATNLDAGTSMLFSNPRPGCDPDTTVFEQSAGEGLTGGRAAETDDDYRARIKLKRANPPASGNDAEYQRVVENIPSIGIQKAFTYPAVLGPGTTAFVFTLRPTTPGDGRIPNGAQIALALGTLTGVEPADDGIFAATMQDEPLTIVYRVSWAKGAAGWANDPEWPVYSSPKVTVKASPAPTATAIRAVTAAAAIDDPQVGQTIAVYDQPNRTFRNKRIDTVTVITPGQEWQLTFSTVNLASDTSYTPIAGQAVSPWSDSLNLLVTPTLVYVDGLGPGEMFATFLDPGLRQKRSPSNPDSYPSTITNKIISPILALPAISNASLAEPSIPFDTPVGTPGVEVFLFELADLAVYGD